MTRVWVVTLNWNNAVDTIDCLESVLAVNDPAITGVVVCDNGSTDASLHSLRSWLRRRARHWQELVCEGPAPAMAWRAIDGPGITVPNGEVGFVLIRNGANLGFSAGNNVGLRWIMQQAAYDHVLVLNNDTVLTPGAVSAMATRQSGDPTIGICGATVVYAHTPDTVQALGGSAFDPWIGRARHVGGHQSRSAPRDRNAVEAQLDYIIGAAMMISRPCLEAVGLLYEGYFLYYEEIDWALRVRRAGFRLGYAPDAEILHKEGATIGSSSNRAKRSLVSEHYLFSSRSRFTWRFYPWFLPSVMAIDLMRVLRSLMDRDPRRAFVQLRAMLGLPRGA